MKSQLLTKIFRFDDNSLFIYDSSANLVFIMDNQDYASFCEYSNAEDKKAFKANNKNCISEEQYNRYDKLLNCGLFATNPLNRIAENNTEFIKSHVKYTIEHYLMRKFILEITQDCNFRCKYCTNTLETEFRRHAKRHMSYEIACRSIDYYYNLYCSFYRRLSTEKQEKLIKHYPPHIGFYGGEPTLNWKTLVDAIEYYKSKDWEQIGIKTNQLSIAINTNLSVITTPMLNLLTDNDITLFTSLDGPKEEHDKMRLGIDGKGTFDMVYNNLLKIKNFNKDYFKHKVTILAVEADEYNYDSTHTFLDALGCTIQYLPVAYHDCFERDAKKKLQYLLDNKQEIIKDKLNGYAENPEDVYNYLDFIANITTDNPETNRFLNNLSTCPMGVDNMMVDVDGNMHICHKTDGSIPIGNVKFGLDIDKLEELYEKFIAVSNAPQCRSCWAFRFCSCCGAVRMKGGDFRNPTNDECDLYRAFAELKFETFIELYKQDDNLIDKIIKHTKDLTKHKGMVNIDTF